MQSRKRSTYYGTFFILIYLLPHSSVFYLSLPRVVYLLTYLVSTVPLPPLDVILQLFRIFLLRRVEYSIMKATIMPFCLVYIWASHHIRLLLMKKSGRASYSRLLQRPYVYKRFMRKLLRASRRFMPFPIFRPLMKDAPFSLNTFSIRIFRNVSALRSRNRLFTGVVGHIRAQS